MCNILDFGAKSAISSEFYQIAECQGSRNNAGWRLLEVSFYVQ